VHPSLSQEEIFEGIKEKYPSVISVTRLFKENIPIPVVAAEFNGQHNIETVLQITDICNLKVKPKKRRRSRRPIQCLSCLDFGYTRNNCHHAISCVYCTKDHYSVNCSSKTLTPICKHCKGAHRADIRSDECPFYKQLIVSPNVAPSE